MNDKEIMMKSPAVFTWLALLSACLFLTIPVDAQNPIPDCPVRSDSLRCSENQVSICWVTENEAVQRCLSPPGSLDGISLDVWLLSYVMDDTITVTDESIDRLRAIIRSGRWETAEYRVFFTIPRSWKGSK